jgi:hypothetical protein
MASLEGRPGAMFDAAHQPSSNQRHTAADGIVYIVDRLAYVQLLPPKQLRLSAGNVSNKCVTPEFYMQLQA